MKKLRKYQAFFIILGVITVFLTGAYLFLLSEYSMRHLWFPLLEEKTGVRISAKKCSVSLMRNQTFLAKGVEISHPSFTVTAGEINLRSSLWSYLFNDIYRVDDLTLNGVNVTVHESPVIHAAPQKQIAVSSPALKKKKTEVEDIRLPLDLRQMLVLDMKFQWERPNGDKISLDHGSLKFLQWNRGIPNRKYEIDTQGVLAFRYGNIRLDQTSIFSSTKFTMLEKVVFPKRFTFHLNTKDANLTAGDFSSKGNSLAVIADLEVKNSALHLNSGSISMRNEKDGDILSVNLSGAAKKKFAGADLKGKLQLYPSTLSDAICSDLFKICVQGLSAECQFESTLEGEQLQSSADIILNSKEISPYQNNQGTPISEPEIHISAQVSGSPKQLDFTLQKADLSIAKKQKQIGEAKILAPWNVVKHGKISLIPLPHAKIIMEKFPLSTMVPFGLDQKYQKETVSFSAITKPQADGGMELSVQGASSFDIAKIGPLAFYADLSINQEQFLLKKSRIRCGTKHRSVTAELEGSFHQKSKSFELDSAFLIHQPEQIFQSTLFHGKEIISPKLQLRGLVNGNEADLFLELSGGKYKMDLISKLQTPDSVIPFWRSKNGESTSLRVYSGENNFLDLGISFRIPQKGTKDLSFSAVSNRMDLSVLRELPAGILPENLDLTQSKPEFSFAVNEEKNLFRTTCNLQLKKFILKNWDGAKSAVWDNNFSLSMGLSKEKIDLWKCYFKTSVNNEKAGELNLTGTLPIAEPKPQLSLLSERLDLKKMIKIAQTLFPEQAAAAPQKQAAAPAAPKKAETTVHKLYDGSRLALRLKRITCTNDLSVDYQGTLSVTGNTLSLQTGEFTVNGKKADLAFSIDPGHADGYPYTIMLKLQDLSLEPILRAVSGKKDPGISGIVRSLHLNAKGKGITANELMKQSSGTLDAKVSRLSVLLSEAKEYKIVQLLLIPLEGIQETFDSSSQYSNPALHEFLNNLRAVLKGNKRLEFATTEAKIELVNGLAILHKVKFLDGLVDSEEINGSFVLPDGAVKLKSETIAAGFTLPVYAKGTLNKIKFDHSKSIKELLRSNLKESLKEENLERTIRTVDDILKRIR